DGSSNSRPNIAEFGNKGLQGQMDQAAVTGTKNVTQANSQWADVDRLTTDQAPWVAMFNPKLVDLVSKRVKGFTWSPQWYFMLDQASAAYEGSAPLNLATRRSR